MSKPTPDQIVRRCMKYPASALIRAVKKHGYTKDCKYWMQGPGGNCIIQFQNMFLIYLRAQCAEVYNSAVGQEFILSRYRELSNRIDNGK